MVRKTTEVGWQPTFFVLGICKKEAAFDTRGKANMSKIRHRALALAIAAAMVFSLLPTAAFAAGSPGFADMPAEGHWSYQALAAAVDNGLLTGSDGRLMPQDNLTRAQMATIVSRAFGASEQASLAGFSDVPGSAWYAAAMARAVQMKAFQGDGAGRLRPEDSITREEAFAVLARAFKLSGGAPTALDAFSDKEDVSTWATGPLAALAAAGYIHGSEGRVNPGAPISREEFAQIMYNLVGSYISVAGTYTEPVTGNVMVNAAGVTMKGLTIAGDLILGDGIGDGDIVLDNVTVTGRLVVRGGGENSIRIINRSQVGSISVGKTGSGGIRIKAEEGCQVDVIYVDDGVDDIILEGVFNNVNIDTDAPVVLQDSSVTALTVSSASSSVRLGGATTVTVAQIPDGATGASIEVGEGAKVAKVESAAQGVSIRGSGTVVEAHISGSNTSVDTEDTDITVSEGAVGVTANGSVVAPGSGTSTGGTPSGNVDPPPYTGDEGDDEDDEEPPSYTATAATYAELVAALADSRALAVTITGEVIIPADATVAANKPVTIDSRQGAILIIGELARLINSSTLTSAEKTGIAGPGTDTGLVIEGGTLENTGVFVNNSRLGVFKGRLVNSGTATSNEWIHGLGLAIENSGTLNIVGSSLTLRDTGDTGFPEEIAAPTYSSLENASGAGLFVSGGGSIEVGAGSTVTNSGTAVNGAGCSVENYGTLTNDGTFTNRGFILNAGTIDGGVGVTNDGADAEVRRSLTVTDEAELRAGASALDPEYSGMIVLGDIQLAADLALAEPVEIHRSAALTVPSGVTLTVAYSDSEWTELMVRGTLSVLSGGSLVTTTNGLEDDAEASGQVTVLGGSFTAGEGSSVTNDGHILLIDGVIDIPESVLSGRPIADVMAEMVAESFADLQEALAEGRCTRVELTRSISLGGNITLDKDLAIHDGVTLTVPDGRNLTIGSGGSIKMLGTLAVEAGGTIINEGFIHIAGTLHNEGSYTNMEGSGFEAYGGTVSNAGVFVNNCHMDMRDASFVLSSGSFTTYNIGGLFFADGSTIDAPAEFHNAGYMKIVDEYAGDTATTVTIRDLSGLTNNSSWIEYCAAVFDSAGLTEAIQAQQAKIADLGGDPDPHGIAVYNRLDFAASMELSGVHTLEGFGNYWIQSYWDDAALEVRPVVLTVAEGAFLTVGHENTLYVSEGVLLNQGTVVTTEQVPDVAGSGVVEVWSSGTFINNGVVINDGVFSAQDEYKDDGSGTTGLCAVIDGSNAGSITGLQHIAYVRDWAGLAAAAGREDGGGKYYARIEIRSESDIVLEEDLTIDASLFVEWDSGIEVPEGTTLTLTGSHEMHHNGDIWVYGTLITEADYSWYNFGYTQVGTGSEGSALFTNGGSFFNRGRLSVFSGGTFHNLASGYYDGDAPDASSGGTVTFDPE